MAFIPFPIPAQLWPLIAQGLTSVAENVGGKALSDKIGALLHHNKLETQVKAAIEAAYQEFERTLPDRDLIAILTAAGQALQQPEIQQLLADVATTPMYEEDQVRGLARAFKRAAPAVADERLMAAARRLVTCMQAQIAAIKELQPALMMLYNQKLTQAIAEQMPLPPFAHGLRAAIERSATRITRELRQGYVTSAHLLYALTTLERGVAPRVLATYGLTEPRARQALAAIIKANDNSDDIENPITTNAEETLLDAQRAARSRTAATTRSEHLLIALLEKRSSSVEALFTYVGVSANQVYNQVLTSIRLESALNSFARIAEN